MSLTWMNSEDEQKMLIYALSSIHFLPLSFLQMKAVLEMVDLRYVS